MFKSFIVSFRLKNTYRVNSILYSIKQLPILKKILPNTIYQNKGLKILGNSISALIEVGSVFIGKFLYLLCMVVAAMEMLKVKDANVFLHIFFWLTIIGGLINTYMFNPSRDKYYAMILMRMDAKKYALSNYMYMLLKVLIGFLPFTIILGGLYQIPIWLGCLLPVFVVAVKMIATMFTLMDYQKSKNVKNENALTKGIWGIIVFLLLLAYGLPYLGIAISMNLFIILLCVSILGGLGSFYFICHFPNYTKIYKKLLMVDSLFMLQGQNKEDILQSTTLKQIQMDTADTSHKKGFAYFHELFVKRHKKILTKSAKKTALISLGIMLAVIAGVCYNEELKVRVNQVLLVYLPYFVFVMYMINRGTVVTQAMFMNCDHSMLTYRFFKKPQTILSLFKKRLKTLIGINLIPAIVIAIGLPCILWITGGTDNPFNYIVLCISIIAMSIFFSVHYLVLYYLLQPYNVAIEMKSSTYTLAQSLTYMVCYMMLKIQIPIVSFGMAMVLFSIFYCMIALVLVYKLAPKTFKLRV